MGQLPFELEYLHTHRLISHLDYYFARSVSSAFPDSGPMAQAALALTVGALEQGHTCLDLHRIADTDIGSPDNPEFVCRVPGLDQWLDCLRSQGMVGTGRTTPGGMGENRPLVLEGDRYLYLARYHDFQNRLVKNIAARVGRGATAVDPTFAEEKVAAAFGGGDPDHTRFQKEAVEKALAHDFVVISGGPGTGKTHITNIIQSVLHQWNRHRNRPPLRIFSLAPTGKAASRLKNGKTIHSALVPNWDSPGFVHGPDNPLAVDMVIVDEASMVDLALMTRLLEAVPMTARVILLGDAHQLAPVQAGSVFSELCRLECLKHHTAFLEHNFRSAGRRGIAALAQAVKEADTKGLEAVLTKEDHSDLTFLDMDEDPDAQARFQAVIKDGYSPLFNSRDPKIALEKLDEFRILCPHNQGAEGRLPINHLCESILQKRGEFGINTPILDRIIIIGHNDYKRGLFNGDTGIVFWDKGVLKAAFEGEEGTPMKVFRNADLPAHDIAYAMTIHKSQGSEFGTVLIRLPDTLSRAVTRELLYTGVTRARKKVILAGRLPVILEAVQTAQEVTGTIGGALENRLNQHEEID